jgi:hypothetical protein
MCLNSLDFYYQLLSYKYFIVIFSYLKIAVHLVHMLHLMEKINVNWKKEMFFWSHKMTKKLKVTTYVIFI